MVARELRSGRLLRLWRDELQALRRPPFDVGADALFVAYYASRRARLLPGARLADAGAHPRPVRRVPGRDQRPADARAARACSARCSGTGSTPWPPTRRTAMRDLVLRGGPWSARRSAGRILDYCQADVDALAALLPRMLPGILGRQRDAAIALGQALLRGRYMAAAARMEWTGVPIDAAMLARLRAGWGGHQGAPDRGGRRPLRRLRGHDLQGRPVRRLPRRHGHPLAAAAVRRAGAGRRHLPRHGQGLARAAAPARAAPRPGRAAARGAGGRRGRAQPLPALRLPLAHRPQPAQQQPGSSSARRPGCAA